jgi:hypothetical protein
MSAIHGVTTVITTRPLTRRRLTTVEPPLNKDKMVTIEETDAATRPDIIAALQAHVAKMPQLFANQREMLPLSRLKSRERAELLELCERFLRCLRLSFS